MHDPDGPRVITRVLISIREENVSMEAERQIGRCYVMLALKMEEGSTS